MMGMGKDEDWDRERRILRFVFLSTSSWLAESLKVTGRQKSTLILSLHSNVWSTN